MSRSARRLPLRSLAALAAALALVTVTATVTRTTALQADTGKDSRGWTTHPGAIVAAGTAKALGGPGALPPAELGATVLTVEGDAVELASLVTGPTFLFYFSASCPHCQVVAPEMARLAQRLDGAVAVLGVASGSNSISEIRAFAKDYGLSGPMVKDYTRKFASKNRMTSTPTLMLVRPVGGAAGAAGAAGFETVDEWRPLSGGLTLHAELRARVALGGDPWAAFEPGHYNGTAACGVCHTEEYRAWGLSHHSVAYWTLYEREKAEEVKCVGCHVTGLGEPSGFVLGDHASNLIDVGCEACHGAGGPHAGTRVAATEAKAVCVSCHDAEHSIRFETDRAVPHIDHFRAAPMDAVAFSKAREDLLEGRADKPLLAFPEGKNLGSKACAACHEAETRQWSKSPHAAAHQTLKKKGSHKDVACLACHAVEKTLPAQSPADFHEGGVGCESCHGPGEQHVASEGGKDTIVGLGKSCPECIIEAICTTCHTPEQDPDWNLQIALPKAGHGKK